MLRVHRQSNGVYTIARPDAETEKMLDETKVRVGKLLWCDKVIKESVPIVNFKDTFKGEVVIIIGKGPTLDLLRAEHFDGVTPVVCINEATKTVDALGIKNPIFGIQSDRRPGDGCAPKNGMIWVASRILHLYSTNPNKYVYHVNKAVPTVCYAINICKEQGIKHFIMVAFDSITEGDLNYAKVIGHASSAFNYNPKRFLNMKKPILEAIGDCTVTWIRKDLLDKIAYIPQQSSHNPQGHHASCHVEHCVDLQDKLD